MGVAPPEFEVPVGVLAAGTGPRLGVGLKALARLAGITPWSGPSAPCARSGSRKSSSSSATRRSVYVSSCASAASAFSWSRTATLVSETAPPPSSARAAGRTPLSPRDGRPRRRPEALRAPAPAARRPSRFAAADSRPQLCDLDEATKVGLQGPRVGPSGGAGREAADAGLALCDAEAADVAERSSPRGAEPERCRRRWLGEGRRSAPPPDLEGLGSTSTPRPTGDAPSTRSSPWSPANRC